ncbi:uncharacterized protein LOC124810448 [Hydra vulgaris]|uniref:uncharacterized protein LOC124810448 n=1 Tax=Hydra vulgaris TaxID=6087 RepID=UPI001F5F0200|nr:uncharacterized protein LOC124810448 [Hydra vulgaris]
MELVRNECSSNVGAALANALLHDIKHLLKDDVDIKDILIDKCKLDRAKSKVKTVTEDVDSEQKKQLICLGVDGKLDQITKTSKIINSPQGEVLKKCIEPEHHLTFTYEDGKSSGNYLTHRTIPVTGATGLVLATETFSVLQEYNSLESIQAVLLDNTATNTGPISGLVVKLEELLKRKLHLIGCALHQNELPLRALFIKLDGDTTGPRSFSGLLGKRCAENIQDRNQVLFERIENPIVDGYIPEEILIDLSCDQRLLFEYCKGIGFGKVSDKWAAYKIGPLNHARWLTLAIRLLCLYTRDNQPTVSLKKLVYFIVQVYAPAWFEIKKSSKFHESPRLIFSTITRINNLPFDDVKLIVKKNIKKNALCLKPENILYAMLKDNDKKIRNFGFQILLALRQRVNNEILKVNLMKIPEINFNANHWYELVDISITKVTEPPTTQHFSIEQIQYMIDNNVKPEISDFPSHSQSVERAVKLVSEASQYVYGLENRHSCILTKLLSRKMRKPYISKGHYSHSYDDIF